MSWAPADTGTDIELPWLLGRGLASLADMLLSTPVACADAAVPTEGMALGSTEATATPAARVLAPAGAVEIVQSRSHGQDAL